MFSYTKAYYLALFLVDVNDNQDIIWPDFELQYKDSKNKHEN